MLYLGDIKAAACQKGQSVSNSMLIVKMSKKIVRWEIQEIIYNKLYK